jgi:hypothetical protein
VVLALVDRGRPGRAHRPRVRQHHVVHHLVDSGEIDFFFYP